VVEFVSRFSARRSRARATSLAKHDKTVQAFWATHVQALNWSGISVKDYAGRTASRSTACALGAPATPTIRFEWLIQSPSFAWLLVLGKDGPRSSLR
jgi:hypothetical protein